MGWGEGVQIACKIAYVINGRPLGIKELIDLGDNLLLTYFYYYFICIIIGWPVD